MDDHAFDCVSKGDFSKVVRSHPALTEARIAILKKNLVKAGRQREEEHKRVEAEHPVPPSAILPVSEVSHGDPCGAVLWPDAARSLLSSSDWLVILNIVILVWVASDAQALVDVGVVYGYLSYSLPDCLG